MSPEPRRGRQPVRDTWPLDRFLRERAIALGHTLDASTLRTYNSAFTSFMTFIRAHNFPMPPSEDTLSFYIVYMSHHISPRSITTYLSGIVQQLEPFYPDIRTIRNSKLIQRTLQGCMKVHARPTRRKLPLTLSDISAVALHYHQQPAHDDLLFLAILITGFFALLHLGEMVFPDDTSIRDWRKISCWRTVSLSPDRFTFQLPFHKADHFFAGNEILVTRGTTAIDPIQHFRSYLASRDSLLPLHSALWLWADGTIPTRSFFMRCLRFFFQKHIGGQSMRAGGATFLAEQGTPPSLIQARGRWSSDAFLIYIRCNPALLIDLISTAH